MHARIHLRFVRQLKSGILNVQRKAVTILPSFVHHGVQLINLSVQTRNILFQLWDVLWNPQAPLSMSVLVKLVCWSCIKLMHDVQNMQRTATSTQYTSTPVSLGRYFNVRQRVGRERAKQDRFVPCKGPNFIGRRESTSCKYVESLQQVMFWIQLRQPSPVLPAIPVIAQEANRHVRTNRHWCPETTVSELLITLALTTPPIPKCKTTMLCCIGFGYPSTVEGSNYT